MSAALEDSLSFWLIVVSELLSGSTYHVSRMASIEYRGTWQHLVGFLLDRVNNAMVE